MKKMLSAVGLSIFTTAGLVTYVLINKNTKRNADKLINSMLDEANNLVKDMK